MTSESASAANMVLRLVLPRGGMMINLAVAYIDESGTHDAAPVLCAGGYLFEAGQAAALNDEMGPIFKEYDIEYFHSAEVMAGKYKKDGKGHFDHLDDDDRRILSTKFIESINRNATHGFVATIKEADYDRLIKPHGIMPGAYAFLIFQCLILVKRWIDRNGFPGDIFYFIEDGAKEKGDAARYLDNEVLNTPEKRQRYRYSDRALVGKRHSPAINAADVLVYRWYSHLAKVGSSGYTPRKDLIALLRPTDMVLDYADAPLAQLENVVADWVAQHG